MCGPTVKHYLSRVGLGLNFTQKLRPKVAASASEDEKLFEISHLKRSFKLNGFLKQTNPGFGPCSKVGSSARYQRML